MNPSNYIDRRLAEDRHRGLIAQSAQRSNADIDVRLSRIAARLWSMTVAVAVFGVAFIAFRIAEAFMSGRVAQILDAGTKGGR